MDRDALKRGYDAAVAQMAVLVDTIQAEGVITRERYPQLIETRLRWWLARERYKGAVAVQR